jgi:hypothetical protein
MDRGKRPRAPAVAARTTQRVPLGPTSASLGINVEGAPEVHRVIPIVALLIALPSAAGNVEARCTELGSACDCSEPLSANDRTSRLSDDDYDPSDSEGAGAKECWARNKFLEGVYGAEVYPVSAAPYAPTGSALAYVLEVANTIGSGRGCASAENTSCTKGHPRDDLIDASTRRACYRIYMNYDADWKSTQGANGSCKNKHLSANMGDSLLAIQDSVSGGGNDGILRLARSSFEGIEDKEIPNFDDYDATQRAAMPSSSYCTGKVWCGMEWCVAGNLAAGTGLGAQFYTWTSDGERSFTEPNMLGTSGTVATKGGAAFDSWMPNLYRQYEQQKSCGGKRRIAYFMQASWDTDAGQRIGKATEIEPSRRP